MADPVVCHFISDDVIMKKGFPGKSTVEARLIVPVPWWSGEAAVFNLHLPLYHRIIGIEYLVSMGFLLPANPH